jgi:chorismate dehydratase
LRKLRISVVQYLNTAPLVYGFTRGALQNKYDLSFTVPSQCADDLRDGRADVAIIPAIEFQRIDDLVVLPDLAIAAACSSCRANRSRKCKVSPSMAVPEAPRL